jgi:predicted MPP superfamily phosphohydrolase
MIWSAALLILLLCTLFFVYSGGTTINDHLVALFVTLCLVPYCWFGYGAPQAVYRWMLALGPVGIWGLFWILYRRRDAGELMPLAHLSQLAFLFSLWGWGFLLFWVPYAYLYEEHLFWPSSWLIIVVLLSLWSFIWTHLRHNQRAHYILGDRGVRIIQLSDIHVSPVMRASDLRQTLQVVSDYNPDLLLLTGDLLMPFSEKEEEHQFLIEQLAELELPIFSCMGNHDLPVQETFIAELEAAGVRVLLDQKEVLSIKGCKLELAGLQFRWTSAQLHLEEVLPSWSFEDGYRILLVHDPRYFKSLPEAFDLVLSGHTHGGQVAANMFGAPVSLLRPFVADQGWFHRGRMSLYVHKGNWHTGLPPRVGVAAEIAIFDL